VPTPTRYKIETLLAEGIQPFPDVDDELLGAIASGLDRKRVMTVPVILSHDGILLDGHQRLRAMLRNGAVFISANDVRIDDRVTADNALEWAVKYNTQRRHLSVEEKAQTARRLQREYGWSQRQIANAFGVSQPAVSQWFAGDDDEGPEEITGVDGKRYPARKRRAPKRPEQPGLPDWVALAGQLVTMLPVHWDEVPAVHRAEARNVLEELAEIIAAQLGMPPTAPTSFD
jgi:Homeodomain-like domain